MCLPLSYHFTKLVDSYFYIVTFSTKRTATIRLKLYWVALAVSLFAEIKKALFFRALIYVIKRSPETVLR